MGDHDWLSSLVEQVQRHASVRQVYGEPIVVGDKTVVPVASVAYGFGGGSGGRPAPNGESSNASASGGGGGGGVRATPAGALEITPEGTRFVRAARPERVAAAIALAFLLGLLVGRRGARTTPPAQVSQPR